ncbi:MAG TPA: hypothetical protein VK673_15495 [Chthoniobacterales bacterium]|nr:hypothetical protein [Chthoniobacterales bacterium]
MNVRSAASVSNRSATLIKRYCSRNASLVTNLNSNVSKLYSLSEYDTRTNTEIEGQLVSGSVLGHRRHRRIRSPQELLAFRRQKEAEWEIQRIARLESQAKDLGVDLRTAERVSDLQAQADTEIRHAKNLLSHYMHMALPCLNLDNHSEIISICDHIVNAAKFETMRQFEVDRAIER